MCCQNPALLNCDKVRVKRRVAIDVNGSCRRPYGRLRTARGRCGSLLLHRKGLAPSAPCRAPGAPPKTCTIPDIGVLPDEQELPLANSTAVPKISCQEISASKIAACR